MWCFSNGPSDVGNSTISGNGNLLFCDKFHGISHTSMSAYFFVIPIGVIATTIFCLSCIWGFRLANTRYFTVPITHFEAVATVAEAEAPAPALYAPLTNQIFVVGTPVATVQ